MYSGGGGAKFMNHFKGAQAVEVLRTCGLEETPFASAGDRTPVVKSVVRHCTT
jgi:hypothetical protein